ncbi:MAG TPA: amidohydrolase family protein [Vicinamibacterales bacterium]|nr:amidohydrolase family protein [Vicinamibacterales bacterium]
MKTRPVFITLAFVCIVFWADPLAAQDLVIANARIIVGTGQVIEQGTIVVKGGRIASVAAGRAASPGLKVVDAKGMTAIAGFIDGHRHIIGGDAQRYLKEQAPDRMREFLEAGYTTLLSGGGAAEPILELKKRVDSGQIKGPRIIPSAPLNLNNATPESARDAIRKIASMGIKFTGEININAFKSDPRPLAALAAAADEGKKAGVQVAVHAVSVPAMLEAVKAGVPKLVHTPHFQWMSADDAKAVKDAGVHVLSCVGFGAPVFNVFNKENVPTFRDGGKWPDAILDGEGRGREAGYKAVNARTLFEGGAVYGYATDTNYLPLAGLSHELRVLNLMFSPIDLITVMGANSATWIDMGKELGTLEAGKLADIVLLSGNPLDGYWNLLTAKVVVKNGEIVVDKRSAR